MDHNLHISDGAFSPDGTRFATGVEDEEIFLHIWDSASGAEELKIPISESSIAGLVFSPDGKRVLFTSYARAGILLDLQAGKELFRLGENSIAYHGIAFSPDGTRLATGNVDGTVKLWDAASGQELLSLPGIMVKFTQGGKRLVTDDIKVDFNNSGASRGFFLDLQELLPLARSRLLRGWTPEECRQFLHQDTCPPAP